MKNATTGCALSNGAVLIFLLGPLDATILGWNGALGGTLPSFELVNYSASNAGYTDIALPGASGAVLLAANFGPGGDVEVYD